MALLRPCGSLLRAISKLPVSCQIEYIRGVVCIARAQGYVTVAPKAAYSTTNIEKLDSTNSNNINAPESVTVSKLKAHLQRQLLSLCRNVMNGKIRREDLLELLKSSRNGVSTYDESIGLALLRNCGSAFSYVNPEDRRNLVERVWEIVSEKTASLTLTHYNTLLHVHIENNQSVDPKTFLTDMTVNPNYETYRLLLKSAAKMGDVESAFYIVSKIKEIGCVMNEDIYNYLIEAHIANKDFKSAIATLETMRTTEIEPSVETYARIACGYVSVGDIKNTIAILDEKPLAVHNILEIVKYISIGGYGKYIPDILSYSPSSVSEYDPQLLEIIKIMVNSGYPDDAYETMKYLVDAVRTDDTNPVYEAFLKNLIYAKFPSQTIFRYANKVMTEMKYSLAIIDVCEAALTNGDRELAMAVFEVMHEKKIPVRPHYYWPILLQSSKSHGEADVLRILKHMLCLNVPVCHETLRKNVLPLISTDDPLVTLRKLNAIGLEISKLLTPLICHLLYQGRLRETLTLCYKIRGPIDFSKVKRPLTTAYKCTRNVLDCAKMFQFAPPEEHYPDELLLFIFGENPSPRNLPRLNDFRRAFENLGIPLVRFSEKSTRKDKEETKENEAPRIVDPFSSERFSGIPHPAEMNLEELECHLIELRSKGMNDRGVLRKLLQLNCRENNPERVEEIRKEFEINGYPWTPGMYSSLLQFYAQQGKPEEALRLYRHLRKNYNGFRIDNFKIILLATSLVNGNYISEAIELLESNRSDGGKKMSKDCWRLLNSVVRGPNSELTESILDILVNAGFCDRTNATLGPLVREHLLKNDIVAAVDTFKKCAKLYNHTPLRQELINALITSIKTDKSTRDEYTKFLDEVQKISMEIYGGSSVNLDLLTALARNEMVDELRSFIATQKIREEKLINSLKHIPDETKTQILMTILDNTTEDSSLNRVVLYEYTLSLYGQLGDCQRSIEVWKKMFADNIIASEKCRKQFASLLKHHKVSLPDEFGESHEV